MLKAATEKNILTYKETPITLSADFLAETLQIRREWVDIFKVLKEKKLPSKDSLYGKVILQNDK